VGHADSVSPSTQFRRSPCHLQRPVSDASDTNINSVCLPLRPQVIRWNSRNWEVMAVWTIWIHRHITSRVFLSSLTGARQLYRTDSLLFGRDILWQLLCSGHYKILFYFTVFFFLTFPTISPILFLAAYYVLNFFPLLIPLLGLLPDLMVELLFGRFLVQISARRPTHFLSNFSQSLHLNIRTELSNASFDSVCSLVLCLSFSYFFVTMLNTDLGFLRPPGRQALFKGPNTPSIPSKY
jgi:hypothetical protein